MRPFNVIAVVFLVLLCVFVAMTLERMRLQDTRIRILEDRTYELDRRQGTETDWRPEVEPLESVPVGGAWMGVVVVL